ncbi:MAG: phosphate ABC transporter substrate-binding protein [Chlorobiaceae bacterium]|nr:phosphate ABC transporter substrate-binding protein [Chlorobiaceae bacterium]
MTRKFFLFVLPLFLALTGPAFAATPLIVVDGSTTVGPIAKSFAAYFTKKYAVRVTVSESGSGNGAKSLINRTCTVAAMSRAMKDLEIAAARSKGIIPVPHVIALDGLAIVVHPGNPVRSLTKAQISNIYRGTVTNWNQVGGPNSRIVVIQRESNSGTEESFRELIIGKGVQIVGSAETQSSNGAVKSRVSNTPAAIGFLGMGFVDRSVKAVPLNGVAPTVQSVKNGSYPASRPLYFYTAGQPSGSVKQFIDISLTAEGKKIISELGFINH